MFCNLDIDFFFKIEKGKVYCYLPTKVHVFQNLYGSDFIDVKLQYSILPTSLKC